LFFVCFWGRRRAERVWKKYLRRKKDEWEVHKKAETPQREGKKEEEGGPRSLSPSPRDVKLKKKKKERLGP